MSNVCVRQTPALENKHSTEKRGKTNKKTVNTKKHQSREENEGNELLPEDGEGLAWLDGFTVSCFQIP